ncbi:hypothetical protein SMSP2_01145 [Limihaloglobus sulfuriphilus]|uniref:Uncharacterized protein n=1 Tax=Limihaloglobus sulfuriphilus TaxID=1851148 RepID=A0A1Q2MDR4_9BACT|nr:hypothetical protein [Limihaloglobus sulfuriphilus]AQQ70784.1 hypothetical protein SMSP2_01145 [Limihaloglobus sulfuriphilus]
MKRYVTVIAITAICCDVIFAALEPQLKLVWEKEFSFEDDKSSCISKAWLNKQNVIEFAGFSFITKEPQSGCIYTGSIDHEGGITKKLIGKAPDYKFWAKMTSNSILAVYKYNGRLKMVGEFRPSRSKTTEPLKPLHEIKGVILYETPNFKPTDYGIRTTVTDSYVSDNGIYYCGINHPGGCVFKMDMYNKLRWLREIDYNQTCAVNDMSAVENEGIYIVGISGESESKFGLKSPADIFVRKYDFDGNFKGEYTFETGLGTFNFPVISAAKSGAAISYLDTEPVTSEKGNNQQTQQTCPGNGVKFTGEGMSLCQKITMLDTSLKHKWTARVTDTENAMIENKTVLGSNCVFGYTDIIGQKDSTILSVYSLEGNRICSEKINFIAATVEIFAITDSNNTQSCILLGKGIQTDKTEKTMTFTIKAARIELIE